MTPPKRRMTPAAFWMIVLPATVVILAVALRWGSVPISWSAMPGLLREWFSDSPSPQAIVLWEIRLPRLLLAWIIGATLAVVGASLQALLRNALADPYVLGISSGAALGAVIGGLVMPSLVGHGLLFVWAFGGSLLTLVLVYRVTSVHGVLPVQTLLLAGVVINALFTALVLMAVAMAEPTRMFGMLAWLMGSLSTADYSTVGMLAAWCAVGLALLIGRAPQINLLTLGDESARGLGVEPEPLKRLIYVTTALLTGAVVAMSGMIGFIGMMVPHLLRLLIGPDHRLVLPAAAITGGLFLVLADLLARALLAPVELPVGVITALCGGPFFLYILWRRRHGIAMSEGR